jgi:hypothetical protein
MHTALAKMAWFIFIIDLRKITGSPLDPAHWEQLPAGCNLPL